MEGPQIVLLASLVCCGEQVRQAKKLASMTSTQKARSWKERFIICPNKDGWDVHHRFGMKPQAFSTRHAAEHFARQLALKMRPSELIVIDRAGREVQRETFDRS